MRRNTNSESFAISKYLNNKGHRMKFLKKNNPCQTS